MKQNSREKRRKKAIKRNRIIFVLAIMIIIIIIIVIKNQRNVNNGETTVQENIIKGELEFIQKEIDETDIKFTKVQYIFFESTNNTALSFYLENINNDFENREILITILDNEKKAVKQEKIKLNNLKKGQATRVNINIDGKIDGNYSVEI